MVDVVSIHLFRREALLSDDRILPITNLFDARGDDTSDATEAVAFVCGAGREWFAAQVVDYATASIQ